jgi:hypothetical protein
MAPRILGRSRRRQRPIALAVGGVHDEFGNPPDSANNQQQEPGCNRLNGSCRVILS